MQRTVKLKLHPTPVQHTALSETMRLYADCFNKVVRVGWDNHTSNGVRLHHETYYPLREKHPSLPSQLVVSAREKACEALKSVFQRQKRKKKATLPKSKMGAMRYDARTYRYWMDRKQVSLSSVAGRLRMPVHVPAYFQAILHQAEGMDSADLVYSPRQDAFWLHLVITLPDPSPVAPVGKVVGVDLGISRIAVTSNNHFFSSKHIRNTTRRYFRVRRTLQTKGTRSARRKLRRLRRRERRFRSDVNHTISKQLVASLLPGSTLVFEDLTHIRDTAQSYSKAPRCQMAGWSFVDVQQKVTYKAQARGIQVVQVDPAYTSQRCPQCGHVSKSNRTSQSWFCCQACGYQSNADRVGALNLAQRGISVLSGLCVNQPNGVGERSYSNASSDDAKAEILGTAAELRCKPPASAGGC